MPKISVIIPVYNVEKYIKRCCISLFEQTLEDIEYLFIDDCSPDKSVDIINKTLQSYPRRISQVRIIRLRDNIGAARVRKMGILSSSGEYVIQCDSDDWIAKDMYESLYNEAVSGNYDVVRCKFVRCNDTYSEECYPIPVEQYLNKELIIRHLFKEHDMSSTCDKIIRRTLFDNNILWPTSHMFEDRVIVTQVMFYAKSIGYIDKVLYFYYQNPISVTHGCDKNKIVQRFEQKKVNLEIMIDFLTKQRLSNTYKKEIVGLKNEVLAELCPLVNDKEIYNIWRTTYPDISFFDLLGVRTKIKYILVYFRIFPFVHRVYSYFRMQ